MMRRRRTQTQADRSRLILVWKPASLHVRRSGPVRRSLVLKAGVELHVAGFVDLLGGEEGGFLFGAVRAEKAGELGLIRSSATIWAESANSSSSFCASGSCGHWALSVVRSIVNGDHCESSQRR
jgi:hypothetical protein